MEAPNLSKLPQIETLLEDNEIQGEINRLSRPVVTDIIRETIDTIRIESRTEKKAVPEYQKILEIIKQSCRKISSGLIQNVINATGVLIHTNMGRSPLETEIWKEVEKLNCGYSNLELDLASGKRGERDGLIPRLLATLVGSEDALVVNNNAAALFLVLSAFACGGEVIVSRGEQVQIGGGFRIPEILKTSGAILKEVGTTNITTIEDYSLSLSDQTAMILSVHRSNFALRGFTETPSISGLAKIKPDGVLLCVDQGSGVTTETLPGEVSVRTHLKNGADLVCFSGDKVLGGPQSGIIVGKKELIIKLRKHPLMRVIRPGKTIYSLLEKTLVYKLNGQSALQRKLKTNTTETLKEKGEQIISVLKKGSAELVNSTYTTGGGSAPDETFPGLSIRINSDIPAVDILRRLRENVPPIIGTITEDRVHLNLATIFDDEIPIIQQTLAKILSGESV